MGEIRSKGHPFRTLQYLVASAVDTHGDWVRMGPQGTTILYEPNLTKLYEVLDIFCLHLERYILIVSNLINKETKSSGLQNSNPWCEIFV